MIEGLLRDYLALPETQFLLKWWFILVPAWLLAGAGLILRNHLKRR